MSRRTGRSEEYEERAYYSREVPARGATVRTRDEEIDVYTRRGVDRDRQPTFLREDYVRVEDQPLVLRERKVETFTRPGQRRSPSPVERERIRTRVVERERSPSPRPVERVRTRVIERERSPEPERFRKRESSVERVVRTRVVEREPSLEKIRTTTRTIERERSPSPVRERIRTRVVERERSTSPTRRPPPIHQEVITHHRHIDHGNSLRTVLDVADCVGYEYALTPPRQRSEKETEIDIYRGARGDTEIDIHT
jgi:hypothetical protein